MTTGIRVRIRHYRVKDGKLVRTNKHKDVSAQIRERSSKRVRVVRRQKGSGK